MRCPQGELNSSPWLAPLAERRHARMSCNSAGRSEQSVKLPRAIFLLHHLLGGLACLLLLLETTCAATPPIVTFEAMAAMGQASDKIHSHGYHRFYPALFAQHGFARRDARLRMLEIGFGRGNSVPLWESLFPNADITWIDYSKPPSPRERARCQPGVDVFCSAGERSRFFFGDQANVTFLQEVTRELCGGDNDAAPCLDVIIDDGGHGYVQQLTSFRVLFEAALKPGGLYVIEDIETSYWTHGEQYGDLTMGGRMASHTPVSVWKVLVDKLNAEFHDKYFQADKRLGASVERLVRSVSFAANMLTATKKEFQDTVFENAVVDPRQYRFRHRVDGWKGALPPKYPSLPTSTPRARGVDYHRCVERLERRLPPRRHSRSVSRHDADAIQLFDDLCRLQFGPCRLHEPQRNALPRHRRRGGGAVLYSLMGGGIGAGFHLLGHALAFALSDNRQIVEDIANFHDLDAPSSAVGFGHYLFSAPSPCGDGTGLKWGLECYFTQISSCRDQADFSRSVYDSATRAQLQRWDVEAVLARQDDVSGGDTHRDQVKPRLPVRAAWVSFRDVQQRHGWQTIQHFVPAKYRHRSRLWFKSHVLWFVMQPSSMVYDAVRETRRSLGLDLLGPNARVVAMHVQKGDKATDPSMRARRAKAEAEGRTVEDAPDLDEYVKAARDLARVHFPPDEPLRVLLVTEDAGVVEETERFPDVVWFYAKDHGRQVIPMKIQHAIESGLTTGHEEMMLALRNLYLSVHDCHAFVGTFTSNWSRLTYELMLANLGELPPAVSVDGSAWYP